MDVPLAVRFFGAAPPAFTGNDAESIAESLRLVAGDLEDSGGIGRDSAEWFETYHSSARILQLELSAYARMLDAPVWMER